jgi:dUTP pyrophosphatase
MEIKYKKLTEDAVEPVKAHEEDAGFDLTATDLTTELGNDGQLILVLHTGIAIEIPKGYVGFVYPRSSICTKSLYFTNSVGVIDSNYRGELKVKTKQNTNVVPIVYKKGEKFAQLIVMKKPDVTLKESDQLSETDRGDKGYGSSDQKEK